MSEAEETEAEAETEEETVEAVEVDGVSVNSDLSVFQINLLTLCTTEGEEEGRKGLDVKRELEDHTGEEINHGRLYPNLDELIELGLLEKGTIDKRTNSYETTDAGEELLEKRTEWIHSNM